MNSYDYDRYCDYDDVDHPRCPDCDIHEDCFHEAGMILNKILHKLYDENVLNVDELESDLEDVCHQLSVNFKSFENKIIKIKRS